MPESLAKTDQAALTAPPASGGVLPTLGFFAARMVEGGITRVAAALSFTTTLQIVPALALVLAMLTAFPAFEGLQNKVQDFIFGTFMPDTGLMMREQFASFVEAAGKLTAFGVVGLVVTTVMLLLTIESSFNDIFKVTRRRPLLTRLLVLWAVITVGPFLIGLSFTMFGYFGTATLGLDKDATETIGFGLGLIMPTLLAWLAATFVYVAVPNRRVMLRDAMIGGAVAAVLLSLLRYGFAAFVLSMTSYQAVYGALAAVPVFLIWVYLTWMAVMIGAVVTASMRDWHYAKTGGSDDPIGRVALALDVIAKLAAAQHLGRSIPSRAMAKSFAVPDVLLVRVLDTLRNGRFVAATDDGGWMLSRDLERTALADVVHQFGLGLDFPQSLAAHREGQSEMAKRLSHHLSRAAESERAGLSVTLAKIVTPPGDAEQVK